MSKKSWPNLHRNLLSLNQFASIKEVITWSLKISSLLNMNYAGSLRLKDKCLLNRPSKGDQLDLIVMMFELDHTPLKAGMRIRHLFHGFGSGSAEEKNPDPDPT